MKYYRLHSDKSRQNAFIRANSHRHVLMTNGERISEDIPTPFEFHDYEVVNILDLVSCANRQVSDTHPLEPSHYFHKLVIDESKVDDDLLLFRLAEYSFEIIIQEKLARALIQGNFNGLLIERLND